MQSIQLKLPQMVHLQQPLKLSWALQFAGNALRHLLIASMDQGRLQILVNKGPVKQGSHFSILSRCINYHQQVTFMSHQHHFHLCSKTQHIVLT
jgi:hypothetical protein